MDSDRADALSAAMASDDEGRGVGEVLASVAGTVAAVPVVLAFVALGSVVLASRALLGVRHAFGLRDGKRQSPARRRRDSPPPA